MERLAMRARTTSLRLGLHVSKPNTTILTSRRLLTTSLRTRTCTSTTRPSTYSLRPFISQKSAVAYSSSSSSSSSSSPSASSPSSSPSPSTTSTAPLTPPDQLDAKERSIFELLARELAPQELAVRDVSGGCGSMYAIEIVSERFRGMGMLAQQRLVNGVLGEEIKGWHGVQLRTRAP